MPIEKAVRSADFPTTLNYLKVMMCNIHDELTRRMDVAALVGTLTDRARTSTSAAP